MFQCYSLDTCHPHWKRPWCWEALKLGEGDNRGWDDWMASPTWWTWVWVSSRSWWWTGRLAGCNPWGLKESDMTERLNWTDSLRTVWGLRGVQESETSGPLSDHAGSINLLCMAVPQSSTRQLRRQCPQMGGGEDGWGEIGKRLEMGGWSPPYPWWHHPKLLHLMPVDQT